MPLLPTRPGPPCLFCAAAARPRTQRLHLQLFSSVLARFRSSSTEPSFFRIRRGNINPARIGKSVYRPDISDKHFKYRKSQPSQPVTPSSIVRSKLDQLKTELLVPVFLESLHLSREDFDREWLKFERSITHWIKRVDPELQTLTDEAARGKDTLATRLRYLFYAQACGGRFTSAEIENQRKVADLRHPAEWYPASRELPRTIHLHVGPTNSGKTYHALKRLEEASSGIYLGPLRLLAHEVYTRLNAKGKSTALLTGDEQRLPENSEPCMFSCTVEMAPLNTFFEVAVIDEIQMINHNDRGWAWTQAFLGLKAKEIHLCGEARTVPIIRELSALVGDKLEVHEYNRLTPLEVAPRSLRGNLKSLQKGDCIVAFTVLGIHTLRRAVEKKTGKKCAIVYGSLPPETRAQQARLFNDPDNDYDFLVASDAIGMGLNLAIKRVIFESTIKFNGKTYDLLEISDIKQIAGRAGRYKTAHEAITKDKSEKSVTDTSQDSSVTFNDGNKNVGYVTTLETVDHQYLRSAMGQEPEPIKTAGLFPPSLIVERFANYFPPGTPFSYILLRLHEICESHPRFHLCSLKDQLGIADAIHMVRNLSIQDRIIFCSAPTSMKDSEEKAFLQVLASCVADGKSGNILDLEHLPLNILDEPPVEGRQYLRRLEQLHKMLVCYLWLSYRFPNVFTTRGLANHAKQLTEDAIESALLSFSITEQARQALVKAREKAHRTAQRLEEEGTAMPLEDQQTPTSTDMSEEAIAILKDKQSFTSGPPPTDDIGEYPEEPEMDESSIKARA